jgi:hypothetical protein
MTTTIDSTTAETGEPPRHRPWWRQHWRSLMAGGLALILLGAGIGFLVYANTYQPLEFDGTLSGPVTPKTARQVWDGIDDTRWIVVGPSRTAAKIDMSLSNGGPAAVTLIGTRTDVPGLTGLRWAPIQGGYGRNLVGRARPLPVSIPAGGSVVLEIDLQQLRCTKNSATETVDQIPVRWSALDVHHTSYLQLGTSDNVLPITLCPPATAVANAKTNP